MTVTKSGAVWTYVPSRPVIVSVVVAKRVALAAASMRRFQTPGETELKVAVTPAGRPVAERSTPATAPCTFVVLTVTTANDDSLTIRDPGTSDSEKSVAVELGGGGGRGAVTVSVSEAVCDSVPLVAFTVSG